MKRMLRLAGLLLVMLVSLARAQNDMNLQGLLGALMGANNSTQNVGVINHREIKAALPSDVAGMKRIKVSSSKQGAMGMTVSQAEAQYSSGREDEYVSIKVTDLGGMGQLGALGMASWATADIDQESDDGFERTVKIAGFKALEKFSKDGNTTEINIMVGSRLMVEVEGNGLPFQKVKTLVEKIDYKKLEALKPETSTGSGG